MISKTEHFGETFYQHPAMKNKIGSSNLKVMDGEDLSRPDSNQAIGNRRRLNQFQQKNWLDQQVSEKNQTKTHERRFDRYRRLLQQFVRSAEPRAEPAA